MEGLFRLLLVAGLLAMVLPAAAATFGPQPGAPCEPTLLATQVALFCAPDMPTAQCCEPVVAAVDLGGGVPCLCRVAAEPQLAMVGLNATHLLTLYTSCGGLRPGGAHLAAACQGPAPAPPAAVVSAPPPSLGHRRKQPAHDAPPPPPSTEMPSPPPQQHDGAGLNASCGGLRPGGAHLAAAFEGSAPPPADVLSAPPPSHGPHRKLRAHEAPPPPPSTEKPSQPPQQHDGVAHSKAVPTYAATSPHAPPAAYEGPAPTAAVGTPRPSLGPRPNQPADVSLPARWSENATATFGPEPAVPYRHTQVNTCPSAVPLTSSIAIDCGSHLSQEGCCSTLTQAVESKKQLVCLCTLADSDAIKQARLSMRDLLNTYAECNSIRPGDVHLPSRAPRFWTHWEAPLRLRVQGHCLRLHLLVDCLPPPPSHQALHRPLLRPRPLHIIGFLWRSSLR